MAKKSGSAPAKTEEGRRGSLESTWEPFASLRGEIDNLFDEFQNGWPFGANRRSNWLESLRGGPSAPGLRVPAVDIVDNDKEVQVKAELPGMDETDIDVQLTDTTLTIAGEKKEEREEGEKEGDHYLSELRYGSFKRSLPVPEGINRDKVKAKFKKGVLTITLPKTPAAQKKTKKIEVKS